MHCPGGNATDLIWRVPASSDGISSWTPLKPPHSNPNPNPLANQLWCIDSLTSPTPLIIPHRLLAFSEHPWDKLRANLPHLQLLAKNCVYSSNTDIKLCTNCFYRHSTVLIHEILYLAHQIWCSDFLTPPTPLIIPHRLSAFLESLMPLKKLMLDSCMVQKQSEAFHTFLWYFFQV